MRIHIAARITSCMQQCTRLWQVKLPVGLASYIVFNMPTENGEMPALWINFRFKIAPVPALLLPYLALVSHPWRLDWVIDTYRREKQHLKLSNILSFQSLHSFWWHSTNMLSAGGSGRRRRPRLATPTVTPLHTYGSVPCMTNIIGARRISMWENRCTYVARVHVCSSRMTYARYALARAPSPSRPAIRHPRGHCACARYN